AGAPKLYRMYLVSYHQAIVLPDTICDAFTDFTLVPLTLLENALEKNEGFFVYNGKPIQLHPRLMEMLRQPEAKRHINALAHSIEWVPEIKSCTLQTPRLILHDIHQQAMHKQAVLCELQKERPHEEGSGIARGVQTVRRELGIPSD